VALPTDKAKADPMMRTVTLTVKPTALGGSGSSAAITQPVVYASGSVDLSTLPQGLELSGTPLVNVGGLIDEVVNTTFDLKITFDGKSDSRPSIDVTGSPSGAVQGYPDTGVQELFEAAPTSAIFQGWTAQSGIPIELRNKYLGFSKCSLRRSLSGNPVPDSADFTLTVASAPQVAAPEPATVLLYLAAIVGCGAHRGARGTERDTPNRRESRKDPLFVKLYI
jgi:hypothetical protein